MNFSNAGSHAREWRKAAYDRELRWARGEGLDPLRGFRGVAGEAGPNPDVDLLHVALGHAWRRCRSPTT